METIAPILLFIWLIINTIYTIKKLRNIVKEANKDVKIVVKCEICGKEHDTTIDELLSTFMSKSVKSTLSANAGTIGASYTHYQYFAKRTYCPTCNKKTWSEIKDYNNLAMKNTKLMLPAVFKYFASLMLGGAIVSFIANLFI